MKSNSTLFTIVCITALIYFYGGQSAVQDAYDKMQTFFQIAGLICLGLIVVGFCIFAIYRTAKSVAWNKQWEREHGAQFEREWRAKQEQQNKLQPPADLLAALKLSMERYKAAR